MDETKTQEGKEKEQGATEENTGEGTKSEADAKIEQLNADTERINQAVAENENAKARQKMSGIADAGQKAVKPEETDKEYNDRIEQEISEGQHND